MGVESLHGRLDQNNTPNASKARAFRLVAAMVATFRLNKRESFYGISRVSVVSMLSEASYSQYSVSDQLRYVASIGETHPMPRRFGSLTDKQESGFIPLC